MPLTTAECEQIRSAANAFAETAHELILNGSSASTVVAGAGSFIAMFFSGMHNRAETFPEFVEALTAMFDQLCKKDTH